MLDQLSLLNIQMNKLENVEKNLKKAMDIYKKKFSEESPSYAKALNDLGFYYRIQGKYAEAEQSVLKAIEIRAKVLGVTHPDYFKSKEDLGILYWKKGDHQRAYNNLQEAMLASIDFINRYFPPMSEAEKSKILGYSSARFQRFYNFCLDASPTIPAVLQDMFDYQNGDQSVAAELD